MRWGTVLLGLLLPSATAAQAPERLAQAAVPHLAAPATQPLHLTYEMYAAGMHVAAIDSRLSIDPDSYRMNLSYHTTGLVGLVAGGHQADRVTGAWFGRHAVPSVFVGHGEWRGADRLVEIDYRQGRPVVRLLVPPDADDREPVPESLQDHSIDSLSALAELIHVVAQTGRCDAAARTYDGRRVVEIEAHTAGEEMLASSSRSGFSGKTLRCDFSGRMIAGFKVGSDRQRDSKPMHGSAWLAAVVPGEPPLPVRMAFETRWVGDAVMYLTAVGTRTGSTAAPAQ